MHFPEDITFMTFMANKYRKTHSTSLIIKKYRDRSEIPLDIYLSCYNQEI